MTTTATPCVGAVAHSPAYYETDRHHTYPKYLCSLLGVPIRHETVSLCSQCHDATHHVLRHLINTGTVGGHHLPAGSRAQVYRAWYWWQEEILSTGDET